MVAGLAIVLRSLSDRPLGGLFFGMLGEERWSPEDPRYHYCDYVVQYVLYWLISSYDTIGIGTDRC
ncbi:hypothetical protein ACLK19_27750 [Escherichia coli]